jgi:hypothetical protein
VKVKVKKEKKAVLITHQTFVKIVENNYVMCMLIATNTNVMIALKEHGSES